MIKTHTTKALGVLFSDRGLFRLTGVQSSVWQVGLPQLSNATTKFTYTSIAHRIL